jgi:hypothetical protein
MRLPSRRILGSTLSLLGMAAWPACAEPRFRLAQAQIQIPATHSSTVLNGKGS